MHVGIYLHDKHMYEAKFDRVMCEFGWHTYWLCCTTKAKPSLTFLSGACMFAYMLLRVTVCHTVKLTVELYMLCRQDVPLQQYEVRYCKAA